MTSMLQEDARVIDEIHGGQGYIRGIHLSDSELDQLLAIIRRKWLENLIRLSPADAPVFNATPMQKYHEVSHLVDHRSAWTKASRIFSKEEVGSILKLPFFGRLGERVGEFDVADNEGIGYPEIYWRLVRPGHASDVAGAHADAWFYDYTNNLTAQQQKGLVKVWVAICVQPGESGLAVLPGSHRVEWPNFSEMRDGRPKPVLGVPQDTLGLINLDTVPGEAVVFSTRLLHAGIAHCGSYTRISIEFAIRLRTDLDIFDTA
jgi:hypothetical protein